MGNFTGGAQRGAPLCAARRTGASTHAQRLTLVRMVSVDVWAACGDNQVMDPKFGPETLNEPRIRYSFADRFYYLHNFQTVISSLNARYADLWSMQERQFLIHFEKLPQASRALLVRMIMRKGDLFRASRLKYPRSVAR